MAEKSLDLKLGITGVRAVDSALASIGQRLKSLKRSDSAEGLDELGKVFRGQGAAEGAANIGQFFRKASEAALQFKRDLDDVNVSASEMFAKFLQGIPVIGDFAKAGANIREIITGEKEEIEAIYKDVKNADAVIKIRDIAGVMSKRIKRSVGDSITDSDRRRALAGATPEQQKLLNIGFGRIGDIKSLREAEEAELKALRDHTNPLINELKKQLAAVRVPEPEYTFTGGGTRAGGQRVQSNALAVSLAIDDLANLSNKVKEATDAQKKAEATIADQFARARYQTNLAALAERKALGNGISPLAPTGAQTFRFAGSVAGQPRNFQQESYKALTKIQELLGQIWNAAEPYIRNLAVDGTI